MVREDGVDFPGFRSFPFYLVVVVHNEPNMFSTLTKFLTEEAADDNEFQNGFTEEQPDPDVKNWILHRSYSFQTDIIHEQLNVELRDEDDIPHVRCALTLTLGSRDTPHSDVRGLIFKPHAWLGPELYASFNAIVTMI